MSLKIRRLLAIIVDLFISIILAILFTNILTLFNFNTSASKIIIAISSIIYIIIFIAFIILKDVIINYSSIGKKIFRISIIDEDKYMIRDKKLLIKRNIETFNLVLFSLYPLMVLYNNKSLGDKKYKTKVIDNKNISSSLKT